VATVHDALPASMPGLGGADAGARRWAETGVGSGAGPSQPPSATESGCWRSTAPGGLASGGGRRGSAAQQACSGVQARPQFAYRRDSTVVRSPDSPLAGHLDVVPTLRQRDLDYTYLSFRPPRCRV